MVMKLKKERYVIVFSVTTLIFILGVILGSYITESKFLDIQNQLQKNILDSQSFELELSMLNELKNASLCDYIAQRLPDIIENKVKLGRRFDVGDIPEENADILKKEYTNFLFRFLLLNEIQEKACGIKKPKILFFPDEESELSRAQGRVLDYMVYTLSDRNLTVFVFNVDWKEPLIKLMVSTYNITQTPSLVIDDKKYDGFQSKEKIIEILCRDYNLTIC
ncbi:MAG: hypothetical protein NT129_03600 [Candidatus Aenigmarchaeota archaeon]|nr:hypothetical protein [Candidatus Aenigmarchaeota archaeon]